jgi:SMC interacting uncharacterized protein involved in chromosome segregation
VLTHKTEELEAQVTAMSILEEQAEQFKQEKTTLLHQVDGLQSEMSKYKELLDSSKARISDISQEREKAVQLAQESSKKDIDQLKHIHTS